MIIEQIYKLSNLIYERKFLQMKETMTQKTPKPYRSTTRKSQVVGTRKNQAIVFDGGGEGKWGVMGRVRREILIFLIQKSRKQCSITLPGSVLVA